MSTINTATPKRRWNWFNVAILILMHVSALAAFFFRPRVIDAALFIGFYLATGFGITIGFHRLLAHRSFECPLLVKRILAFLGTAALQGGPIWWIRIHRLHHQASDCENDPHSPHSDFLHGHMRWMLKRIPLISHPGMVSDLTGDRFLRRLDYGFNALVPWLCTIAVCFILGGVGGVIWGGVLRTLFVWHATWSVNSICHRWGRRPYRNRDDSGNVWWVGLLALGEGWHNNHHACPTSAMQGLEWWEIDLAGYIICIMEKVGLAWNVKRHPTRMINKPARA